jgi:hypothetical protein
MAASLETGRLFLSLREAASGRSTQSLIDFAVSFLSRFLRFISPRTQEKISEKLEISQKGLVEDT